MNNDLLEFLTIWTLESEEQEKLKELKNNLNNKYFTINGIPVSNEELQDYLKFLEKQADQILEEIEIVKKNDPNFN